MQLASHKQLLLNCVCYLKYNSALLWLSAGVQVPQKSLLFIAFLKPTEAHKLNESR